MHRKLKAAACGVLVTASVMALGSCSLMDQLVAVFFGGNSGGSVAEVSDIKAESFDSISIGIVGDAAGTMEYEVLRTDSGAQVSYYIIPWNGEEDTPKDEYLKERVEGGEEFYGQLLGLVNECGVKSWDGFTGHDPDVLDGSSFSMTGNIDGKDISARGTNAFPDNYGTFIKELRNILNGN